MSKPFHGASLIAFFNPAPCLLVFTYTSFITGEIILTLSFYKIYDDQMLSPLGFLTVGKKGFINVYFVLFLILQEVAMHVEPYVYF